VTSFSRTARLSVVAMVALVALLAPLALPATAAAKPKGTPIVIGVIGSFTGPQASSSRQAQTVAPAWAKYVNGLGGINGHPVKVVLADDGGDPAKAQAAEKTLVDQNNVVAIVVSSDNEVSAFNDDAISKKVTLVSGSANATDWYQKAGMFPTPTDVLSGLAGQAIVATQFGKAKKFADLYCAEIAACKQADPILKGVTDKAGIGFTSISINSTAPSYQAECLELKNQNVDYAQLNFSTDAAAKFVQDCQQQGFNPTWGSSEQAAGAAFKSLKNFTMFGPTYAFPSVAKNPEVKKFRDAMKKYAKGKDWAEGTASFTWGGLEMLRSALGTITTGDPTRETVLAAMNSVNGEDLNGLLPNKLTFTGQPVGFGKAPCFFVVGMKGGKVTAPNQLTPVCPPAKG
jgi:branched-chain amino acid transport system substrate-binding protein